MSGSRTKRLRRSFFQFCYDRDVQPSLGGFRFYKKLYMMGVIK